MKTIKLDIGTGIFSVADVSKILNIPYTKVSYWFNAYISKKLEEVNNFVYYKAIDNKKAVNFYTLFEILIFQKLREKGFRPKKILKRIQKCQNC